MIQALQDVLTAAGAIFADGVVVSFGNDEAAIRLTARCANASAKQGVVVCDRSHWGRIQVADTDRLRFLHNQTTNDFQSLKPGQGCDTVFVSSTARTIDLASAYVTEDTVLLLVSPSRRQQLIQLMDKYLFPMDRVQLKDVTDDTATFTLIGAGSDALLDKLGATAIVGQAYANHQVLQIPPNPPSEGGNRGGNPPLIKGGSGGDQIDVRVAVGSGLALPGYTLIVSADNAAALWGKLVEAGAVPMGDRIWERLRIEQGRPVPDRELTDDYNPLEAGLWQTISFNKGCYIGQETIARLNTYKGVKQQLWGVRLNAPAEPGTPIMIGEEKIGKLTSYTETEKGPFGLAYIRTKAGGEGLKVQVGETEGQIVDLPFLTRQPQ
ncbi:CAF17-like 4Fe-4S cluster assembly/insertion protein YgfZ [Microseira wollei]|uniref:Glycine cleavage T protein (Aminomethyl transferase) n=1 Tax=Microseira wollei NIES-4236 TaxID=2530354 RepID=A0AAV3X8D3_9CYAN|nr:folate-binding protein [Microseira wollei]GET36325.1 glycine cleavage T protein (aminomethyl transferase) [Microseira wollei NIES-4236]